MSQTHPTPEALRALIDAHVHLEGPMLPILHAIQQAYDHVPDAAVPLIAEALNLGRAEVHGVISFYHDFRAAPAGRHVIRLCRAEACQAMGGADLGAKLLEKLGLGWGDTSRDGRVTVEAVYCLGLCACAPAAQVDGRLEARLTPARMDALLAELGA